MGQRSLSLLREELLSVKGVGPETADSILLYAFDQPTFVIDAYTKRIFSRYGLVDGSITYHDLQQYFQLYQPMDIIERYHGSRKSPCLVVLVGW